MIGDISGEPCPRCGCKDTRVVARVVIFGTPTPRYQCRHCARQFSPPLEQAASEPEPAEATGADDIQYVANCRCPRCAARNPPVKSTQRKGSSKIRYHRCDCGHRFRSVEPG